MAQSDPRHVEQEYIPRHRSFDVQTSVDGHRKQPDAVLEDIFGRLELLQPMEDDLVPLGRLRGDGTKLAENGE
jgi:hypothetical protein